MIRLVDHFGASIPVPGGGAVRSRSAASRELRGRSAVGVAPLVVTA